MDFLKQDSEQLDALISAALDLGLSAVAAAVIIIAGFWLAGFIQRRLVALLDRSARMDTTVSRFLGSLAKYAIILVTIIAVLDQFGVETTSLVAVLGAAGLAVGLALQGTLSNVAAGVMLLLFRPFRIGQFVEIGGQSGTVDAITLFTTELDTPDNVRQIIPNSTVWGSAIINYSHHDRRRLDLVFGISYGDDMAKAKAVIEGVLAADSRCQTDPAPVVVIGNLGDFSVDVIVRVWCLSGDYWALKWDLLEGVKQAFDREGVSIPFPTNTVIRETA
ncbi:mechanosensitive ion channel family protein [Eilatimonas milleporae]|uniref:Small-conductance mechanosensitive channel n=1 Tax=Eilatimonas milleporae TaxID=911205 RepID=A0A3M0D876_9PROT|nr:mechanosensitive ion channel domain-containing protein [Eilatimonas milleporae]RMB12483.1 small conductance mechanosensitive channel [Eilatimonas milleporae]